MTRNFWDIETLENVFTLAVWCPDGYETSKRPTLVFFILADDPTLMPSFSSMKIHDFVAKLHARISELVPTLRENHPDFDIMLADLHDSRDVTRLIRLMGLGGFDGISPKNESIVFKLDNDDGTVSAYNEADFAFDFEDASAPLLLGYNSYNYDTTILARYFELICKNAIDIPEKTRLIKSYESTKAGLKANLHTFRAKLNKNPNNQFFRNKVHDISEQIDDYEERIRTTTHEREELIKDCHIDPSGATAHELRYINDLMFSGLFQNNMGMSLVLAVHDVKNTKQSMDYFVGHGYTSFDNIPEKARNYKSIPYKIRQFWLKSGRHIDVAKLNEKQVRVGLKRQLGVLGRQIFESEAVRGSKPLTGGEDAFIDLLAYNTSDVVNLQFLYEDGNYIAPAQNKAMIIETYPETIFEPRVPTQAERDSNEPINVAPAPASRTRENLRKYRRLTLDSTSQQIISTVLAPTATKLSDSKEVSLMYPAQNIADTEGMTRRDILLESDTFFRTKVLPTITDPMWHELAERQWSSIFNHYNWVIGKNFNASAKQRDVYGNITARNLPGVATNIIYFGQDGRPTSYYATVSEGGVHGAEFNLKQFERDLAEYRLAISIIDHAKSIFGADNDGAANMLNTGVKTISRDFVHDTEGNEIIFPDGKPHLASDLVMSGSTRSRARWRTFKEPKLFEPSIIKINNMKASGKYDDFPFDDVDITTLSSAYAYTSAAHVNHEDFASYYPNLIRRMQAFMNPDLNYDRYGDLYDQKQTFGLYQKNPDAAPDELKPVTHLPDGTSIPMTTDEARRYWKRRRDGVKLMLNAGSGAGDAKFDNPIRMNNNIIAMRIIGQLFTWRIGQAQALLGAGVPSTNTDGLYTIMEANTNNAILERESATIGVEIEPEEMELISKDANNRIEFVIDNAATDSIKRFRILSAGGSLSSYRGPDTSKSIAHPAIYDWGLAYYLMNIYDQNGQAALEDEFDENLMRELIAMRMADTASVEAQVDLLRMFLVMRASSPAKFTYPTERRIDATGSTEPERLCQHYSRVFMVKPESVQALIDCGLTPCYMRHATAKLTRSGISVEADGEARKLLREAGHTDTQLASEMRVPTFSKIPGIEMNQLCTIENSDLFVMDAHRRRTLIDALDINAYINEMRNIYETSWRNAPAKKKPWSNLVSL